MYSLSIPPPPPRTPSPRCPPLALSIGVTPTGPQQFAVFSMETGFVSSTAAASAGDVVVDIGAYVIIFILT